MTREEKLAMGKAIYDAFVEGYNSYASPACPFNTVEEAWAESSAKVVRDQLVKQSNANLDASHFERSAVMSKLLTQRQKS